MIIRQWARRTWWRAKRALVRRLDRWLGTRLIEPPDTMRLEVGRNMTIHLMKDHDHINTLALLTGDVFRLTVGAATISGIKVSEPLIMAIDVYPEHIIDPLQPQADRAWGRTKEDSSNG